MKYYLLFGVTALLLNACKSNYIITSNRQNPIELEQVIQKLHNPNNKDVLIAAHRGDWRNAPENSIQGLKNCISMGVDIVELDLKKSKDGQLIIMHDETIDRTTTGKGKPENWILKDLKQLKLLHATGHPSDHEIPTLDEFCFEAKGKVVLCIDKGFQYFDEALEIVNKHNMNDQIIYNIPAVSLDSLKSLKFKNYNDKVLLNILRFPIEHTQANIMIRSYQNRKNIIMHPTFKSDTISYLKELPNLKKQGMGLWINALWAEHNGGHDDDRAVERDEPNQSWGWVIDHGATIIQTDRPKQLLEYLRKRQLHN
jgi:glycerophosphoryl diester phosphodiesterase